MGSNGIRVSNRILKLVGQNLYTVAPVFPVTVRELLQNSHDAQQSRGSDKPIQFIFRRLKNGDIELICDDSGIGMDKATIKDKFLVLGETGKEEGVGGFGVAKAAIILACDKWELHTRDNRYSSDLVELDSDVVSDEEREGCRIDLLYSDQKNSRTFPSYSSFSAAMIYLATSAAKSVVRFENQVEDGTTRVTDVVVDGLHTNDKQLLEEINDGKNRIRLYCVPITKTKMDFFYEKYSSDYDVDIENRIIYRLNGLTQFVEYSYGNDSNFNIVVDITTNTRPDEADYPFTLSREEINATLSGLLKDKIKTYFANSVTTRKRLKETSGEKKVYRKRYRGGLATSKKEARLRETIESIEESDNALCEQIAGQISTSIMKRLEKASPEVSQEAARVSSVATDSITDTQVTLAPAELLEHSPIGIKTLIRRTQRHLRKKATSSKSMKLLQAWAELVALVMSLSPRYQHSFGIGLVFDSDYEALRETDHDGTVYYLFNPLGIKTSDPMNAVMLMFLHACHEVTHTRQRNHGEEFTTAESYLQKLFLETYGVKKLYEIARFLRLGK